MEQEYFGCSDDDACSERWFQLMEEIGLETDLTQSGGATEEDYRVIISSLSEGRLKNHPIPVTRAILSSLFTV